MTAALNRRRRGRYKCAMNVAEHDELEARWQTLTPREQDVFLGIVAGALNKEVAFRFGISEKTVKIHRAHVMEKMGARSFADLVRMDERLRPDALPVTLSS